MRDTTTQASIAEQLPADDELGASLREAIDAGELTPVFQPLFDLRSQSIYGFEALAQWTPHNRPLISAADFIPLAAAVGLLPLLTEKLLRSACLEAAGWPAHLRLAVNIAPLQLQDAGLLALIRDTVVPTGFPLSRLELEITEQASIGSLEHARAVAQDLKRLGIRLTMDSCGVGHSTLSRLKVFPFDSIKVDSGFICSLEQDGESRKIVAAIIGLGQSLRLFTIAKGVERQSQVEILMRMGCDAAQGWLYGHPVPAQDMPAMILAERPDSLQAAPSLPDKPHPRLGNVEERLAHLEVAYNKTPLGLAYLDLDFRYVSVNEKFAGMFGRETGAFIGFTVAEVLPESQEQIMACLERSLAAIVVTDCEISLADAQSVGQRLIYLHTCQAVQEPYGGLIGLSVALVDITRRKRSEAMLRKSERNYRQADALNPHIPWTANPDGSQVEVSSRWHSLTQLKAGLQSTGDWMASIHPKDTALVLASWATSMRTGVSFGAEYRIICGDGRLHWLRTQAAAGRGAQGEILRWYGIVEDIHAQKSSEYLAREKSDQLESATRKLELLVRQDHLTGLANRRFFDETLQREVKFALRSQLPLALVMLDVDAFKSFNDCYGHVAGDACLRQVATLLTGVLHRPTDLAARYGGEEFALILPNTTEQGAFHLAEQTLSTMRALSIAHNESPGKQVTLSAGLAMLEMKNGCSVATLAAHLVHSADVALYAAKEGGRDRLSRSTPDLPLPTLLK